MPERSNDEIVPVSEIPLSKPITDIVTYSKTHVPWLHVLHVVSDLVLGMASGLGVFVVISAGLISVLFLITSQQTLIRLLYLMHVPIYYFAARHISESKVFRNTFITTCSLAILLLAICTLGSGSL